MDAKLKHLEFIQGVISRMATNSFLFKGWAITIAGGLSAFAAAGAKTGALIIALVATLMFWALDGYYLWLERCFIALYDKVATTDEGSIDFSMTIDKAEAARCWFKTCWRPHLCLFYGAVVAVEVVGVFVIRSH